MLVSREKHMQNSKAYRKHTHNKQLLWLEPMIQRKKEKESKDNSYDWPS